VSGALAPTNRRGRPIGTRRGEPGPGVRLNVVETLRAAAPWQPLRRREAGAAPTRVQVRRDDFRITRFKQRNESAAIFVVDASGSAALHRLAEAKGAVELLLADCYTRRDHVALIAFRNKTAELLLPPTRSLTRAKNSIMGLPGGGGTPLAAGLDAALALAEAVKRRGQSPAVVLLTDGRANIARDGTPGRGRAAVGDGDPLGRAHRARGRRLQPTAPGGGEDRPRHGRGLPAPAARRCADPLHRRPRRHRRRARCGLSAGCWAGSAARMFGAGGGAEGTA
jgi:magnesium chelatase subunit D